MTKQKIDEALVSDPEFQRTAYLSLSDEMTGPDMQGNEIVWDESDWDPEFVEAAKRFASKVGLDWPPMPDIDGALQVVRAYERKEPLSF